MKLFPSAGTVVLLLCLGSIAPAMAAQCDAGSLLQPQLHVGERIGQRVTSRVTGIPMPESSSGSWTYVVTSIDAAGDANVQADSTKSRRIITIQPSGQALMGSKPYMDLGFALDPLYAGSPPCYLAVGTSWQTALSFNNLFGPSGTMRYRVLHVSPANGTIELGLDYTGADVSEHVFPGSPEPIRSITRTLGTGSITLHHGIIDRLTFKAEDRQQNGPGTPVDLMRSVEMERVP